LADADGGNFSFAEGFCLTKGRGEGENSGENAVSNGGYTPYGRWLILAIDRSSPIFTARLILKRIKDQGGRASGD
jgi:hypothetical protein